LTQIVARTDSVKIQIPTVQQVWWSFVVGCGVLWSVGEGCGMRRVINCFGLLRKIM